MRPFSDLLPFSVTAGGQDTACCSSLVQDPSLLLLTYKKNRYTQRKRGKFGSWGPSSLFRHSLFSLSKNTSETASLPAHGESEFHSIKLKAAQSEVRSCFIYCTSRYRVCAPPPAPQISQMPKKKGKKPDGDTLNQNKN